MSLGVQLHLSYCFTFSCTLLTLSAEGNPLEVDLVSRGGKLLDSGGFRPCSSGLHLPQRLVIISPV